MLIRTSTERPEVLDKGTIVIGGITGKEVEQAVVLAVSMAENKEEIVMAEDYADTNVSVKVVKVIQSYAGLHTTENVFYPNSWIQYLYN